MFGRGFAATMLFSISVWEETAQTGANVPIPNPVLFTGFSIVKDISQIPIKLHLAWPHTVGQFASQSTIAMAKFGVWARCPLTTYLLPNVMQLNSLQTV